MPKKKRKEKLFKKKKLYKKYKYERDSLTSRYKVTLDRLRCGLKT